ncbi:MAG: Rrf2 family transcriptional regulator [Paludibacterium sp.]|uniref:Rrf2 family transcriptional regulator n=1 Tax=Paludibacterium sp. TaxID=1917523 RepID=UPI0025FC56C5|nr:Rrf2 family transcriptional regulator [Paludibacterium sp.]MBV8049211.1 Rrf2 family transcriptional regulator [Paludibacterium sp.]MBV8647652.1 Rrf2 family transcriptional regulator [Paludibacterium sp.]
MNLTRFSDYALRVLICSAVEPARLFTIAEIADGYGISENHLMKVVHRLAVLGLLETVRGKNGGLRLARPADQINLGEVLRQTEQGQPLVECFEGGAGGCRIAPACQLKTALKEAEHAFYAVLDRYTLADMVTEPASLAGLLPVIRIES